MTQLFFILYLYLYVYLYLIVLKHATEIDVITLKI
jgi:hypothetical protein